MDWLVFRESFNAWSHGIWALASIPATLLLLRLSQGDTVKELGMLVYGMSMLFCFSASALYHGVRLPESALHWFATLDFIGVYLLIAGTATPLTLVVLRDHWRYGILILMWTIAIAGIGLRLSQVPLSRLTSTSIYLGMGWIGLLFYFELARTLSHRAMRPAVIGGLLYSIGAVLNLIQRPVLWPGVFSYHEVWHLFVMAGSMCHYRLVLGIAKPQSRIANEKDESDRPDDVSTPTEADELRAEPSGMGAIWRPHHHDGT